MSKTCRMVTQSGTPCTREAEFGGMGFCWQHAPKQTPEDKKAPDWERKVAIAGVVLTGVEVLTKVIELAVEHLGEFFGSGDPEQERAKSTLVGDAIFWPSMPKRYSPGSRVDWLGLLAVRDRANLLREQPSETDLERLELDFDRWFTDMNDYHRQELLRAIEAWTERPASDRT